MGQAIVQLQLALLLLQGSAPVLPGPEPLFRQAVAVREKQFGAQHPKTAEGMVNLALFLRKEGRDAEAAPILQRVLIILQHNPESNRTTMARVSFELADLSAGRGDLRRALQLFEQAFKLKPSAAAAARMGELLEARGDFLQAEAQYRTALALAEGPAEEAGVANSLGLLMESQSRGADAEALFARAATLFEKAYGQRHPEFATVLVNLANAVRMRGDEPTAAGLFVKAIQTFAATTGTQHPHAQAACRTLLSLKAQGTAQSAVRRLCEGTNLPGSVKTPIQ